MTPLRLYERYLSSRAGSRLARGKQRRGVQRPWTIGIFPTTYGPLLVPENFYVGFISSRKASHQVGKQPRGLGVKEKGPLYIYSSHFGVDVRSYPGCLPIRGVQSFERFCPAYSVLGTSKDPYVISVVMVSTT